MYVCVVIVAFALPFLDLYYQHYIVDRGPTVGPTDGHGPGLFDLCTVAVRSRSGYLGLTAVHGPLKSSGPRQHCWGLITGQFAAPFAVDHTQCQIPRTSAGRNNGQIPH